MTQSALEGIRVIELTHAIAGPQCGQILADHGADVIKIEPPAGERARNAHPIIGDESLYFACHNRGKRSVILDLKSDPGIENFYQLIKGADIVVTNYSVDVPKKLKWDYESLAALNPRIVMVHITGFGATSKDRDLRAYDGVIQAMSGIPDFTGTEESGPVFVGAFVADHVAAYHAALGAMFALRKRELTGKGEYVDISMLEAYSATGAHAVGAALENQPLTPTGNAVPMAYANTFLASDGWIYLAPLGDDAWQAFCHAIDRPDWAEEISYASAIFERREETEGIVTQWCQAHTRDEIAAIMKANNLPCGPVLTPAENAKHSMDDGRGGVVEVDAPGGRSFVVPGPVAPVGLSAAANRWVVPRVGQHTAEVLEAIAARD